MYFLLRNCDHFQLKNNSDEFLLAHTFLSSGFIKRMSLIHTRIELHIKIYILDFVYVIYF